MEKRRFIIGKSALVFAGVLWVAIAKAQPEMSVEVGSGVFFNGGTNIVLLGITTQTKPFLKQQSFHQFNIGRWDGQYRSTVVGVAKGLEWGNRRTKFRMSTGASLVSETSNRLSTPFQFYEQFMIQHRSGNLTFALSYRHWSNANIKKPNWGMDFFGLQIDVQL